MTFEIDRKLAELGLNKSDIKVYLSLLKSGSVSVRNVSRETNIARTNCYHLLKNLLTLGLVEEEFVDGKKYYSAKTPESILEIVNKKKDSIESLIPILKSIAGEDDGFPQRRDGYDEVANILSHASSRGDVVFYGSVHTYGKMFPESIGNAQMSLINSGHHSSVAIVLWDSSLAILDIWTNPSAIIINNQEIVNFIRGMLAIVSRETISKQ